MSSNVVSPPQNHCGKPGWSPDELAELQRTVKRLNDAGFTVEAGWGATDEGDPWFAFIDKRNDDLIVHFARLNGSYTAIAPALPGSLHARDLQTLAIETIQRLIRASLD